VLGGGVWHTLSSLAPQRYVLVLSVVAARFLGTEGMGRQSFISFAATALTLVVTGGIPVALTRYTGERLGLDRDRTGTTSTIARRARQGAPTGARRR
jgi:O-antigen/teichoic acid export membrane protein